MFLAEQLEEEAVNLLEDCLGSLNIDYNVSPKVELLPQYLEKWRVRLWDKAFNGHFTGSNHFIRTTKWTDVTDHSCIARRLIYR